MKKTGSKSRNTPLPSDPSRDKKDTLRRGSLAEGMPVSTLEKSGHAHSSSAENRKTEKGTPGKTKKKKHRKRKKSGFAADVSAWWPGVASSSSAADRKCRGKSHGRKRGEEWPSYDPYDYIEISPETALLLAEDYAEYEIIKSLIRMHEEEKERNAILKKLGARIENDGPDIFWDLEDFDSTASRDAMETDLQTRVHGHQKKARQNPATVNDLPDEIWRRGDDDLPDWCEEDFEQMEAYELEDDDDPDLKREDLPF